MKDNSNIEEMNRKLGILIKLFSYQVVGGMTLSEGAPLLRRIGLSQSEIADIYGSTAKSISVRLAEAKKKTKRRNLKEE